MCLNFGAMVAVALGITCISTESHQHNVNCRSMHSDSATMLESLEVYATGVCRCVDGTCQQISCSAESGVSVELTKIKLRVELEAKARSLNGKLDEASVSFTIRKKFESR